MGGGGFGGPSDSLQLDRYLLGLTGKSQPTACFLATASGEPPAYIELFHEVYGGLGCQTSDFSFFRPPTADVRGFLQSHDLIYVGGGNTKSMLALWREWGVDEILREHWTNGAVLAGLSAGAICWFEQGVTDSIPGPLTALDCLGFLPGSCCPHYDSEPDRQPAYTAMIKDGSTQAGFALDDFAGIHFAGSSEPRAVASLSTARAFWVSSANGVVTEQPLPVHKLN